MSSTPTTSLRLEKIGFDEQNETWGTSLDQMEDKVDASIAGYQTININGLSTRTLTAANFATDEAANMAIAFTGTLTQNCTIVVPSVSKYTVYINSTSGGFATNIQTATGNTYSLPAGFQAALICDGLNHSDAVTFISGALQVGGAISANQFTASGGALPIGGGGTGATTVAGAYANLAPPGVMQLYCGTGSIPTGWYEANGALVSRTGDGPLFGAIGVTFGAGDGSTTFALPDFRGRVAIGAGTGAGLSSRTAGNTGGEENHLLSQAELPGVTLTGNTGVDSPGHTHSGTTLSENANHTHNLPTGASSQSTLAFVNTAPANADARGTGTVSGAENQVHQHSFTTNIPDETHVHGFSIGPIGGNVAHNNMPPFLVVRYIIKR